jgi:hypothetical protein
LEINPSLLGVEEGTFVCALHGPGGHGECGVWTVALEWLSGVLALSLWVVKLGRFLTLSDPSHLHPLSGLTTYHFEGCY